MDYLTYSINNLKSKMVNAFCDKLQSAQLLKFQPPFLGMFHTCTFQNLDFNTRVEPLGVHSLLEPRTMCVHDYEINTPTIQDFLSHKVIHVLIYN